MTENNQNNQSKNLPIIIAIAVVILLGGASTWYFMSTKPNQTQPENIAILPSSSAPITVSEPQASVPSINSNPITNSQPSKVETTPKPTTAAPAQGSNLQPTPSTNKAPSKTQSPIQTSKYKDGTYTATGSYVSPGGPESVEIQTTLKDGKISDVNVTPKATNSKSVRYQGLFADGIKGVIVGKSLDSNLDIGVVNGSSLTGMGFTQAIDLVRQQAQK